MPTQPYPHYLKTYRKCLGFSQLEIAFLLGDSHSDKVCRYERFTRLPALESALAYAILFQAPLTELFAGVYARIQYRVSQQVEQMHTQLQNTPESSSGDGLREKKLYTLTRLLEQTRSEKNT